MRLSLSRVKQVKISDNLTGKRFITIETEHGDVRIELDGMIYGSDANRVIPIRRERT